MRHTTSDRRLASMLLLILLASGCSASTPSASAVQLTLREWAVVSTPASVPHGTVTFLVTNDGPNDVHEFVIIRTDLDPGALPTDEHGAVVEDGEGIEVVAELEDIPVGLTRDVTLDLENGRYVLLCNVYREDEDEAHYAEGMRTAFTVE
jgi:hypothetical protein